MNQRKAIIVLNFGDENVFTPSKRKQVEDNCNVVIKGVIGKTYLIDGNGEHDNLLSRIEKSVLNLGLTSHSWADSHFVVHLPDSSIAAAMYTMVLYRHIGRFLPILFSKVKLSLWKIREFTHIVDFDGMMIPSEKR